MQLVKPVNDKSRWILEQIFPGRADFLMHQAPLDRMEAVATYLAEQIKVKIKSLFETGFRPDFKKYSFRFILWYSNIYII